MQSILSLDEEQPYNEYVQDFKAWRKSGTSIVQRDSNDLFRYKISMENWIKLRKDLNLDDESYESYEKPYPRFSYHPSTSTLIVQYTASPVHQAMVDFLSGYFYSKLSGNVKVQVSTGGAIQILRGKSAGERKVPELCIREKTAGSSRGKWVLEVGFSETYKELLEDIHSWLTGRTPEVIYGILVKITEDPRYHCPLRDISDEEVQG